MSERLIADIPYNIVELAVHDWVKEKKGEQNETTATYRPY